MTTITWNQETEEIVYVNEFSALPEAWEHVQAYKEDSPYVIYRFVVSAGLWRILVPKQGFRWYDANEGEVPDIVKLAGQLADF